MIKDLLFVTFGLPAIIITAGLITGVIAGFWTMLILLVAGPKNK